MWKHKCKSREREMQTPAGRHVMQRGSVGHQVLPTSTAARHQGKPNTPSLFRSPCCACHQGSRQPKAKRHQVTKTRPPPPSLSVTLAQSFLFFGASSPRRGLRSPHKVSRRSTPSRRVLRRASLACRSKTSTHKVALTRISLNKH